MSFTLRVQGLGAFWPGANMTGSEFRRERLGQERLGQGAKWQYGHVTCYVKVTQYYNIFCNTAGLSCQCLHVTVTHTKVYDITKRNHVFIAH